MITWIWAKLTANYGNLWSSQFLDDRINKITKAEWAQKLRKFPQPKVYEAVENWKGKYPPNIQELVASMSEKAMHREYKALPKPKGDQKTGEKWIKHIRNALRK